jgi:hypothetical protein
MPFSRTARARPGQLVDSVRRGEDRGRQRVSTIQGKSFQISSRGSEYSDVSGVDATITLVSLILIINLSFHLGLRCFRGAFGRRKACKPHGLTITSGLCTIGILLEQLTAVDTRTRRQKLLLEHDQAAPLSRGKQSAMVSDAAAARAAVVRTWFQAVQLVT